MKGKRITTRKTFEAMAGYSRVVVDEGIVYIFGTTGYDARNNCFPGNVKNQAIIAFSIIEAVLKKARSSLENMLRIRSNVASRSEFEEIKPIIKANCEAAMPANTTIICDLAEEVMRVEFEVTAKSNNQQTPSV